MADIQSLDSVFASLETKVSPQFIAQGSIPLTEFFNETLNGDYLAGGAGLFCSGSGIIVVSDNIPSGALIEAAFLYWQPSRGLGDPIDATGILNGTPIEGQVLTTVNYPAQQNNDFIRADVTEEAQFGSNTLTDFPHNTLGASLVIVYSHPSLPLKSVIINDGGIIFQQERIDTTFENFIAGGLPLDAKTTYIVGEGTASLRGDEAIFNDTVVEGPDAFRSRDGLFWDTLTVDVGNLVSPGDTSAEASISTNGDILVWIAQVFSVTAKDQPQIAAPIRGVIL